MTKLKDGGPAFPLRGTAHDEDLVERHEGMSLRAWLVGQALSGICAQLKGTELVVGAAFKVADAVLAELEKD